MQDAQTDSPGRPGRIIAVGFLSWPTVLGVIGIVIVSVLITVILQNTSIH